MLLLHLRADDDFQLQEMQWRDAILVARFENQIHVHRALQMCAAQCVTKDLDLPAHLEPIVNLLVGARWQLLASDQLAMDIKVPHEQSLSYALQVDHVLQQDRDKSFQNRR